MFKQQSHKSLSKIKGIDQRVNQLSKELLEHNRPQVKIYSTNTADNKNGFTTFRPINQHINDKNANKTE